MAKKLFQKGECNNPKGRPKGIVSQSARKIMEEMGFNPVEYLIMMCMNPHTSDKVKVEAATKLLDRYSPPYKPIDYEPTANPTFTNDQRIEAIYRFLTAGADKGT